MKTLKLLCAAAAAVMMTGTARAIGPVDPSLAKVVVLDSGKTLRFVCAETVSGTKGTDWFSVAEAEAISPDGTPPWYGKRETVNKVVFDESFVDYRPTQCYRWFYEFEQLVTIENIENLDTSAVTDMAYMFYHCSKLNTLDLSGFDTSAVTDMSSMFYECLWLKTIFASDKFVTTAVTASDNMFYGCYKLSESSSGTVYDHGRVDKRYARIPTTSSPGYFTAVPTAKVVVLQSGATLKFVYDVADYGTKDVKWFSVAEAEAIDPNDDVPWWDCGENVTKVIFDSSFADYKPKQCSNWLYGFSKLKTIENIENLDTSKATNMEGMFIGCSSLESLDVTRFDTSRVTGMKSMFYECSKLKTIYASDKFVTTAVTDSDNMFYGCTALVGGNGTAYDSFNPADKTYARIDGGRMSDTPGYFTLTEKTAKAVLTDSDTTLRFVFDRQDYGKKDEDWFSVAEAEAIRNPNNPLEKTPWEKCWVTVTAVVFDPSFKDYRPTRCSKWFSGLERLVTIEGIRNLDTSAAICMNSMFSKCKSLESLDITGFDTSKVTNMSYMFYFCKSLRSLDFRNFSTANVTSMNSMFGRCSLLTALDLRNFETTKLTDAGHMFEDCASLAMLDISGFCAAKVALMDYMFRLCGALRTIIVSSQFGMVSDSCRSDGMFSGCTALVGGKGTAYDPAVTDKTYARIDGKDGLPGYLTQGCAAWAQVGVYGKWTLADLGIEPATAGTVYSVKAYGLPSGLKLKYNAAKKDKKGRVTVKAKTSWWIEGVPTSALNALERPTYLAVTVGKKTTWYPVWLSVKAQMATDMGTFAVGTALKEVCWLPGVTNGWSVSGLPKGLSYTAKTVYKDPKKKSKGVKYAAYTTYGKFSAAGLYTITAKKKRGSYYETLKFKVLVNPAGEFTTRNFIAYTTFATMKDKSWKAVGGLPAGLKFDAKKYTVSGKITKAGTFAVTFTDKKGKKKTEMWIVAANPAGPSLDFNTTGERWMSVLQGQTGEGNALTFPADGTVSVSGLPKGMKLVKNTDGTYALGGVPSKTGTYFVTVKAAKNGRTVTQRVAVTVKANPVKGTYYGSSTDKSIRYRTASLTIASSGKATMKYTEGSKTYTLTASAGTYTISSSDKRSEYRFVQKANTKKKIPARVAGVTIYIDDTGAMIDGEWWVCSGTEYKSGAELCEGAFQKAQSAAVVNAIRTDPLTGFAAKATYALTSAADPAQVIYATYAYSSSTGKFTVKGKLPLGKAFSATVAATRLGLADLELAPISAADADGARYLLMLKPGGNGQVFMDGLTSSEFKIYSHRYDFGTGYTALPTTFAAAVKNTAADYIPVTVTYPAKGTPLVNEKEEFLLRATSTKYFQVSFDGGATWTKKADAKYDKKRGFAALSFTKGKTKYTVDLLYAEPEFLCGQMKRQSNPVYNKKTKKTTYTTEYGLAAAFSLAL